MAANTILFRARVPAQRLKKAEKILEQLGMKPGDAFNMLLAQIELRKGLPFDVTTQAPRILSSYEQAAAWTEAMGADRATERLGLRRQVVANSEANVVVENRQASANVPP